LLEEFPRSLCLYEQGWLEVKVRWTAASFVERIRDWLSLTSEGTLHGADQPLEPIIQGTLARLVIPSDLSTDPEATERLIMYHHGADPDSHVYTARRPAGSESNQRSRFVSTTFVCKPQQHGIIRKQPQTLADLSDLVAQAGVDLLAELKNRISTWYGDQATLASFLILIGFFPKTRGRNSGIEATDIWAFITSKTVSEIGEALGVSASMNGITVPLIGIKPLGDKQPVSVGSDIPINILNPTPALSRDLAARLNGLPSADEIAITAVGVGALGSQLIPHLVRAGYGKWTLIDDDVMLPHNVARHELTADAVGFRKAETMSLWLNTILEERGVTRSITANLLTPGDKTSEVETALREAAVIVDMSASLAVSRTLASSTQSEARRVSLFLSPSGSDLIVLAEDRSRTLTLDVLEMFYYREVATNEYLTGHLASNSGPVRYAQSCRDLTSRVPGEFVGLHAAIGSRALREAIASDNASIRIWRAGPDLSVSSISVPCPKATRLRGGAWIVISDDTVENKIADLRRQRLPNETGGVLIGHFDVERRIVYVADVLGSPPDSKEWPTVYIRGAEGLSNAVAKIQKDTASMLQYVGEWHSHPDGYSTRPSSDDKRAFDWLVDLMEIDRYPGVMLIAGQDRPAWYLGTME
jgi:proteasome lid subunit RPN8/RPN11